jgi:hypothetical protein
MDPAVAKPAEFFGTHQAGTTERTSRPEHRATAA